MTKICLHGFLAHEFGSEMYLDLYKSRDIIRAIDCNKKGFRKKIIDLHKQGFNYDIIIDKSKTDKMSFLNHKNPKQIDIVPLIIGQGAVGLAIAALAISVGAALISYSLMDPGTIEGGSATVAGNNKSMILQGGAANIASQGSPIPIGYGRLLVGSQVIQSSFKSFPQTSRSIDVMTNNIFVQSEYAPIELLTSSQFNPLAP